MFSLSFEPSRSFTFSDIAFGKKLEVGPYHRLVICRFQVASIHKTAIVALFLLGLTKTAATPAAVTSLSVF
jgi:hypothetical protein